MITKFALFLLFTQLCFAEIPEEGVTYSYPFVYDDSEEPESKPDDSKKKSPPAWEGKIGNADVTIDVKEPDFLSECQAKWDSMQKKKDDSKEKRRSSSWRRDDEENRSPGVSVSGSIKW